jgi:two-component SAPR family response regulator
MSSSFDETLFLIKNNNYDVILLDLDSYQMKSNEIALRVKKIQKNIFIIAMTKFENLEYDKNIYDYTILKPITIKKILKLFINIFKDKNIKIKKKI